METRYTEIGQITNLPYGTALIDIECVKERAEDGVAPYRFRTVMIGVLIQGESESEIIQIASDNETELLRGFEKLLYVHEVMNVGYCASRDFDRNVLGGLWTNARAKMASVPRANYPYVDWDALKVRTFNVRKLWKRLPLPSYQGLERNDISSFQCIEEWKTGDRELVWEHNLIDMKEMARNVELRGLA